MSLTMKKTFFTQYNAICVSFLICLWSIDSSSAFTTQRQQSYVTSISPLKAPTSFTATAAGVGATLPNPFQKLPWNARKEREREGRRLKLERSRLHREIGISEDATYEEIVEATDMLISRAGDDLKQKIKIEVAKDKILQIRLNERLAGLSELSKDVRAQSNFESQGQMEEENEEDKKKEQIAVGDMMPNWTKGLIVKPDKERFMGQLKIWGGLTLITWTLPPLVDFFKVVNCFLCVQQIMLRGTPKGSVAGGGFGRSTYGHGRLSFLLGVGTWFLGSVAGIVLLPSYLELKRTSGLVAFSIKNLFCFVGCLYIQTYKGAK